MDCPALEEEVKVYPLALDVVKEAPKNLSWELLNVLGYIGFGQYHDAERFMCSQ